jgi:hypothetical protein
LYLPNSAKRTAETTFAVRPRRYPSFGDFVESSVDRIEQTEKLKSAIPPGKTIGFPKR